ncbi:hypothetical protein D3C78_326600 [compost metagenome]
MIMYPLLMYGLICIFFIAFPKNNDSNSEPACLVYFVPFPKRVEVLLLLLGNLWYLNRALAMPCSPMF